MHIYNYTYHNLLTIAANSEIEIYIYTASGLYLKF